MSNEELGKWYRGGAVYRAANVVPMTARTWKRTVNLEFGQETMSGHPKYDLIDILCLAIMRSLTLDTQLTASFAANIVNNLRPALPDIAKELIEEGDSAANWRWEGFPFAVAMNQRSTSSDLFKVTVVRNANELVSAITNRRNNACPVIIPIVPALCGIRMSLLGLPADLQWDDDADGSRLEPTEELSK